MPEFKHRQKNFTDTVALTVAILVAAGWTLCYYWHEYDGDDLAYILDFSTSQGLGTGNNALWEAPVYWVKHWVLNNGRAANLLFAVPMLNLLPKWLNAIVCGLLFLGMLLLVARNTEAGYGHNRLTLVFVTVVTALVFPWWHEGFQLTVCVNYVATSCLVMAVVWLWSHPSCAMRSKALCVTLCFVAGMMHEAASVSILSAAIFVYLRHAGNVPRFKDSKGRRAIAMAFAAGASVVIFSPGIWVRFFKVQSGGRPHFDGPWLSLLFSTLPLLLLLLALVLALLLVRQGRGYVKNLFRRDWFCFWFVSSVVASAFVFAGRLEGNSGWFAELFALCALAIIFNDASGRFVTVIKTVMLLISAVFVVWNSFYVAEAMRVVSRSVKQIRCLYADTSDDVVFYDFPASVVDDPWLFDRVHRVHDVDFYTMTMLARYYGKSGMVVLPVYLRDADIDSLIAAGDRCQLIVGADAFVAAALPEKAEPVSHWTNASRWRCVGPDGREYMVLPFRLRGKIYYLSVAV